MAPAMELYDWLLFLHVLSAFVVVAALTALWGLVIATRPGATGLDGEDAGRFGAVAGPLVGAGMMASLVFGIWLALDADIYDLLDGWIIAALVLWAIAGWAGSESGKAFQADPVAGRAKAVRLHTIATVAILVILVLMIWKPGA